MHALALCAILGLGVFLFWPSLRLGLFADDFTATAMMDGLFASKRAPLDLFDFADGSFADVMRLRRLGSLPWWAPADFRVAFLRPFSSALFWIDRALFGQSALVGYHVHSLLAWALLVIAAHLLYRRLFSLGVALAASLIFAIDDSQHFAVIWISNRGGIYALFVGVLGLLAHLRFRRDGRLSSALLCTLAMSAALAFGEWALPIFGYVLAYELVGSEQPWHERALALLPAAIPALLFLLMRALLGYGARGSGAYIDPFAEPLRFVVAAAERIPIFVADMLWNIPSSWWDHGSPWRDRVLDLGLIPPPIWRALPSWRAWHLGFGALGAGALFFAVRGIWPALTQPERVHVRVLLLGGLFSLLPVVSSFPSTRLTVVAFLGLAPIFALVLRQLVRALSRATRSAWPRFALSYALVVGLLWFQVLSPLRAQIGAEVDDYATTVPWVLAAQLDVARLPEQRVFLLNGAEFTTTFFFAYIWAHYGRPLPRSYYPLSTAPFAQEVERVGENALRLHALGGQYLGAGTEYMFCEPERRWFDGETIGLDGAWITAERTVDGLPLTLLVRFARPLEDPSYVFLQATALGLKRFEPPALGEKTLLPVAAHPNWLALARARREQRFGVAPSMLAYTITPPFIEYRP